MCHETAATLTFKTQCRTVEYTNKFKISDVVKLGPSNSLDGTTLRLHVKRKLAQNDILENELKVATCSQFNYNKKANIIGEEHSGSSPDGSNVYSRHLA